MIYLLRHGQTDFNAEGRYQGQKDSPLTAIGRDQAVALAGLLRPLLPPEARIVASPLGRAMETATLFRSALGLACEIEQDRRLMEVGMGAWDGLTRAEIATRWPRHRKGDGHWMFRGPGGESFEALSQRLAEALADHAARGGQTVIVSHAVAGRVLRALHVGLGRDEALALEAPQDAAFRLAPGGEITRLDARPNQPLPVTTASRR